MTGTISAVWLRVSVKRRTEFVPTAATVESIQVGELGREFRLPRLGEEPPKVRVRTPDDLGKVIGREERTAKAIRTPLGATGMKLHRLFTLEIIEDGRGTAIALTGLR